MDAKGRQYEWPEENPEQWLTEKLNSKDFTMIVYYRGNRFLSLLYTNLILFPGKW